MNSIGLVGASGFIGKHILLHRNESTNIIHLQHRGSIREIHSSLRSFNNLIKGSQSSIIYLAENNDISEAEAKGKCYIEDNTSRLKVFLDNTHAKIIYASSVDIYGDKSDEAHFPEENLIPSSTYAKSKFECEKLVLAAGGTIARISNVYGQGMSSTNIISEILAQISDPSIESIKIRDGSPKRDFINVYDVASCLIQMAKKPKLGIYNVGTGEAITMKGLTSCILSIFNLHDCKIIERNPSDTNSSIFLDITSTLNEFEWSPKISLQQGLESL
ncbi:NAD(P)-dependent oxidoreductase [Gammaproteobacteria bacterium]|nr:NAD(P)-dependent oxidoreductase [Gammaproteobacteria bacterium]